MISLPEENRRGVWAFQANDGIIGSVNDNAGVFK